LKKYCLTSLVLVVVFLLTGKNGIQGQSNYLLTDSCETKPFRVYDSGYYFSSLGDKIFYRRWGYSDIEINKKVILIIHGIGFHSYPYKKIMNYIENDSIQVYAMDLRGHGLSGKAKGMLESNEKILTDMDNMICIIMQDNPNSEIYLMGVSMGGIYALGYAIGNTVNTHLSGLILVGAALKTHRSQIVQISNLMYLLPAVFNRHKDAIYLDGKRLELSSNDHDFINSRRNDSLSIHYLSVDYLAKVREMQKMCKRKAELARISLPVLIQHGGKDKIIDLKGSYYLKENLTNSKTELIVYPESKHSLLWDNDSSKVFNDIVRWVIKN
jgi:alpha-beta hydrolase superfamily lysophospholipase